MDLAIYYSTSHDCAANLAGEAYLMDLPCSRILYLWVNDPCVVIGRFQNPHSECDLDAMKRDGVQLVRRQSGGGAVYHDRGNLCFTLIGDKETATKEENFALVVDALAELGIPAEQSGRNDILHEGRKISGNAFRNTKTKFVHHGTLLVKSDLSVMADYLTPSDTKLASKAVKSVASRVGNLREAKADITVEEVELALERVFRKRYGESEVFHIDFSEFEPASANYRLFGDLDLILRRTPPFTHSFTHRFAWGEATLNLHVSEDTIDSVTLFTDSLDITLAERTEALLVGVRYEAAKIAALHADEPMLDELVAHLLTRL
ncbi:MAG: lipoate--protein ligase [Spirochaetales bacterium]|nr:lipoate--protein ligase [Spirochaetales bacterium]